MKNTIGTIGLKLIDEELLYKVLSIPSCSRQEQCVQSFLMEHARLHGFAAKLDDKGNVYLRKGFLPQGEFFPCVTAHMDTVHYSHIPFINENKPIPLQTQEGYNEHYIYAEGFGLGGDDKAGIVVALTIMEKLQACKAVFFVEEEIGCGGSDLAELSWFSDVGYIIAFDSPGRNCASWACSGVILFSREFYETFLEELGPKYGLTRFEAHPYTDVMVLRMNTCLACMNFGAGYYNYHSYDEFVVAEDMDHAVDMGLYLIGRLGHQEYVIPFTPHHLNDDDQDYDYFTKKFARKL